MPCWYSGVTLKLLLSSASLLWFLSLEIPLSSSGLRTGFGPNKWQYIYHEPNDTGKYDVMLMTHVPNFSEKELIPLLC